ncbi:SRPBCC family protein [Nocardioides dongkuii]|uniref:SRPBCC family protein n=1 Tax=Nocardioides dongkuii TaxID=2760089 RepID=UPI0015FAA413|nr:SRPBCC family protein [Nocardioides dongkuii]
MVHFPVPPEVAFDYLVDPAHRPAWQSSLARVESVTDGPAVGQTWVDVTAPGPRPRMETTVLDRPHRWTERGTWRSFTAELTLEFAPAPGGCEVEVAGLRLTATGLAAPVARALAAAAPVAVRSDLRRAATLLADRA